jgi:ribonuclease Z
MKITFLGTGSPESHARRASSGYLVEVGTDKILLDCGGGVVSRLIESGRLPSDVTHLFFTHLHTDHMMDYGRLIHAAWDEGRVSMKVIGPAPIASITEKLFGKDGVLSTDLHARTENQGSQEVWLAIGGTLPRPWPSPEISEVEPGFYYEGNGWKLTSCSAPHAQPWLTCMAFRIEAEGKSFVYSGDSALSAEVEELCKDADVLLHWCYRMKEETSNTFIASMSPSPDQIGEMAERAGVRQLFITHMRKKTDTEKGRAKALADVKSTFTREAKIAEDLDMVKL